MCFPSLHLSCLSYTSFLPNRAVSSQKIFEIRDFETVLTQREEYVSENNFFLLPLGWLEPLLARIKKDPTTVVCPVIDVIDDNTFEYHYSKAFFTNVGGFFLKN